jgi:membrane dipeptidase
VSLTARADERATVVALHTDFIGDVAERYARGERGVLAARHVPILRESGVHCVCEHVVGDTFEVLCFPTTHLLSVYDGEAAYRFSPLKHNLWTLAAMLEDVRASADHIQVATTVAEIEQIRTAGKIAMILCFQGAAALEDTPELIRVFYRLGLRRIGLAVNNDNAVAHAGMGDPGGLTKLGRQVVREACDLNMVLDVSHLSDQSALETIDLASRPVMASNSNARALRDLPRNLSDTVIDAIGQVGGVIGVHVNPWLLTESQPVTIEHVVDHLQYIAERIGVDHVGVGPDVVTREMYPADLYDRLYTDRPHFKVEYPEGFTSFQDLPALAAALRRRGFGDTEVDRMFGLNALRVFRQVWGA